MSRMKLSCSALVVLLILTGIGYLQIYPADVLAETAGDLHYGNIDLFQASSDREECLRECRERFGIVFGPDDPRARAYARCVNDCEQQFWQDFDRETGKLEPRR